MVFFSSGMNAVVTAVQTAISFNNVKIVNTFNTPNPLNTLAILTEVPFAQAPLLSSVKGSLF